MKFCFKFQPEACVGSSESFGRTLLLPKVLHHGMCYVYSIASGHSQHERVSEPRLYQVPCNRTYGTPVHFLRYVPNESCQEHKCCTVCVTQDSAETERCQKRLYQVPGDRT